MSEDVVIRAEGLGKKYIIGHQSAERSSTLRDAIVRSARNWGRSFRDLTRGAASIAGDETEEFWALKDVSFEIKRGDVVGVIGRNGAGKSTLLKVLSRITEPSEGRVEIKGRIASLLEVGTGFHPELSGRENIYLNGAILGMGQAEIKRKFDEIVDFAEIEKFLDTPVKRYSSGMYVRLAFAVAAHLEPEILIVDEVLAVGDAEFQKKCLGKMQDVAGHGRTVIFVSHNMAAVERLCRTGLLLRNGSLVQAAKTEEVIGLYQKQAQAIGSASLDMKHLYFSPRSLNQVKKSVVIRGQLDLAPRNFVIAARVLNLAGEAVFWTTNRDLNTNTQLGSGEITYTFEMPDVLAGSEYWVELVTFVHNEQYIIAPGIGPRLLYHHQAPSRGSAFFLEKREGTIAPLLEWTAHASSPSTVEG
jgi:lipopolysaccharide transport system ATP-binding protein